MVQGAHVPGGTGRSAGPAGADDLGAIGANEAGRADRLDVREREAPPPGEPHRRPATDASREFASRDPFRHVDPARDGAGIGAGGRVPPPRDINRGDAPDDMASQALDESFEDAQSGDFIAYGGFEPQRLAQYYVQLATGREPGRANAARMEELADKLVDRILVSGPSDPRTGQMRMKLVSEVLDGAEVWMRREKGELQLNFKAGTERSREFLTERRTALEDDLSERLKERVRVDIEEVADYR